jgi:hypothetical protein
MKMTDIGETKAFLKASLTKDDVNQGNAYVRLTELKDGKSVEDVKDVTVTINYK